MFMFVYVFLSRAHFMAAVRSNRAVQVFIAISSTNAIRREGQGVIEELSVPHLLHIITQ